jgi:hypothetical protein
MNHGKLVHALMTSFSIRSSFIGLTAVLAAA